MTKKAESNYQIADTYLADLKKSIPLFLNNSRLRLATFDELNIAVTKRLINDEYVLIENKAKSIYLEIAKKVYKEAYDLALSMGYKDGTYTPLWLGAITDWLLEYDEVTGYVFSNEIGRKRDRLTEKVISLLLSKKSLDSIEMISAYKQASRYINDQVIEYGDIITYKAMIKAYEDAGVKRVVWLVENDNRVCDTCLSYGGFKFDIDKVPPKPHWGCRCWLLPIRQRSL